MSLRLINQVYFPNNKLFLTGFAQWSDSPGNTYGLGGNTPNSNGFELERGFIKMNQNILFRVAENFYVGPNITLDRRYKIRPSDEIPEDLDDNQKHTTSYLTTSGTVMTTVQMVMPTLLLAGLNNVI